MKPKESPYRIIVMGKTGSGKSSILNALISKEHFKVGNTILSETKEVQTLKAKFKGKANSPEIEFIDTPGFFDSSSRDNKIIAKIAMSLHEIHDGVNLVLFCFPAFEIRLDSSMQASWRFLRLVMGRAVYEHVIIILTHGDKLNTKELEKAVDRMANEFIPYLRNNLDCKVKEEIFVYMKGKEDDGLDGILNYIVANKKYKPEVMEDLVRFWNPNNPSKSIENLLVNSEIFTKIQTLLQELQAKSEAVQEQVKDIKQEIEFENIKKEKKVEYKFKRLEGEIKIRFEHEKKFIELFKSEINGKINLIQKDVNEKYKQVNRLWKRMKTVTTARGDKRVLRDIVNISMDDKVSKFLKNEYPMGSKNSPSDDYIDNSKAQQLPVTKYHASHSNESRSKKVITESTKSPISIKRPIAFVGKKPLNHEKKEPDYAGNEVDDKKEGGLKEIRAEETRSSLSIKQPNTKNGGNNQQQVKKKEQPTLELKQPKGRNNVSQANKKKPIPKRPLIKQENSYYKLK